MQKIPTRNQRKIDILPCLKTRDSIVMRCITRGITAVEEDLPFGYSLSLFTKFHWVSGTVPAVPDPFTLFRGMDVCTPLF